MVKKAIKKKYTPNSKEKYMCAKHKKFFTEKLLEWRKDIIKSNNDSAALSNLDDNSSSADIATFPWIARHEWHDIGLKNYRNLSRWYEEISKREAVIKGFDLLKRDEKIPTI